jgi:hypothetical protein
MNFIRTLCACSLLAASMPAHAQKPAVVQVNSLLSRIPIPDKSAACYDVSTKTTGRDGIVSIKDNGPVFNQLTSEINNIMTGNNGSATPSGGNTPPTPEQIEQMKQQAMQRAAQYQNGTAATYTAANSNRPANTQLMQEIGMAQSGQSQLRALESELSSKMAALAAAEKPSMGPNCPEVRQGSYVGPTCTCERQKSIDYESRSVELMDNRLQKIKELLLHYIPLFSQQIALVDKAETDGKYGEGISDPTTLQMLNMIQRQALATVTRVMGYASAAWTDGANQYLELENARNKKCP